MKQAIDSRFPNLLQALDPKEVRVMLERALQKNNRSLEVLSCEIADVKYEPGEKCLILYKADLSDACFGRSWKQLFLGKVLRDDEKPELPHDQAMISEPLGILFSPFPHDPLMTWLPQAFDPAVMKKKIEKIVLKNKWKIKNLTISLLAYTPQMRTTFLYCIEAQEKKSGIEKSWEWIAKTNYFKEPHRVFSNYYALWKSSEGTIPMPKPVAVLLDPPLTFQEKIEGTRLGGIVDDPNFEIHIKNTALNLARFHGLKFPLSGTRKADQEIRNLNRWCRVLCHICPSHEIRAEKLKKAIGEEIEKRMRVEAPVHADFHHTNILVHGECSQLIDMDEMAYGDPSLDVGRFLSSLRIPSLRTFGSFSALQPQRDLFLETYLQHAGRDLNNIRLFEAASLFTSAASTFRLQRQNWEEEVPSILDEAEKAFAMSQKSKAPRSQMVGISKTEALLWAKDAAYVAILVAPHLHKNMDLQLIECELKEERMSGSYHSFRYKYAAQGKEGKSKGKFTLFIHKKRDNRAVYQQIKKGDITILPRPLAYLPELGALVFEHRPGLKLTECLSPETAKLLAKGFVSIHNKSAILNNIPFNKIKVTADQIVIPFPFRLAVGNPLKDVGDLASKALLWGNSTQRVMQAKQFVDNFISYYAEASGKNQEEVLSFVEDALGKELSSFL